MYCFLCNKPKLAYSPGMLGEGKMGVLIKQYAHELNLHRDLFALSMKARGSWRDDESCH